jgi:hypothetical protein
VLLVASEPHTPGNRSVKVSGTSSHVVHFEDGYDWDSDDGTSSHVVQFEDDYGWDTDDDIEEANAADDMIKMIEGDW